MNEIRLSKMEQRNFKGTVHHILDLKNGSNASVFGDNANRKNNHL